MTGSLRSIEILRAGWGLLLLVAPRTALARVHGADIDRHALVVTRILGARHLTQGVLSGV